MKKLTLFFTVFCMISVFNLPMIAQTISYNWVTQLECMGEDHSNSVAITHNNQVIVAGHFIGSGDFNPGLPVLNKVSNGGKDFFVQKLTDSGNLIWAITLGGVEDDVAQEVAVDNDGNVYVAGSFKSIVDFDGSTGSLIKTSAGQTDAFLAKFDTTGNIIWVAQFGGVSFDEAISLSVDNAGNPIIVGQFVGTIDLDPSASGTQTVTANGARDAFVVKLDPMGDLIWAKTYGGAANEFMSSMTLSSTNEILISGVFADTVDFDPGNGITKRGAIGLDGYFLKLDANGNFDWVITAHSMGTDQGFSASFDGNGDVYVAGSFENSVSIEGQNFTSNGLSDAFVAKVLASGSIEWALAFGVDGANSNSNDYAYSTVAHSDGGVIVTGFANGNFMLNNDPNQSPNFGAFGGSFVMRLDENGNYLWSEAFDELNAINKIALNVFGDFYMAGYYVGTIDFDPSSNSQNFTSVGSGDMFLAKYNTPIMFSVSENSKFNVNVYPNPNHGIISIPKNLVGNNINFKIYTLQGQILVQEKLAGHSITLPNNITNGSYLLSIEIDGKVSTQLIQVLRD